MLDLVIIGAGPAGIFAATHAAMKQIHAVVIESSFEVGGQLTLYRDKNIYDLPGYSKIKAGNYIENLYEQYSEYKELVPLYLNTQAIGLEKVEDGFKLITNNGPIMTKTILLTNGGGIFQPRELNITGINKQENIKYYIQNINDYADKRILVLGGGDSAVDWAVALSEFATVYLSHRRNDFRAHEHMVKKAKEVTTLLTPYQPISLKGENKVTDVVLQNLESKEEITLKIDEVLVFYGTNPVKNKQDIWEVELDNNAIKVNSSMETSNSGIFAAGNAVYYKGKVKMIVTALGEAATAITAISNKLYPNKTKGYNNR